MTAVKKKIFKNPWMKLGLLSLSVIFTPHADGSSNDIKPFSEMWGTDLTAEQSSYKYTPAIFARDHIIENLKNVLERSSEEERSQHVFEITYKFMDEVRKSISKEEKKRDPRLSYKELAFAVDRFVNDYITYEEDKNLYNQIEYYATPYQTISNKEGDCEDFAILKYTILKKLYFPEERMRLAHSPEHMNLIINVKEGIYQLDNDKHATRIPISSYRAVEKIMGLISLSSAGRSLIKGNIAKRDFSISKIRKYTTVKTPTEKTAKKNIKEPAKLKSSYSSLFNSFVLLPKILFTVMSITTQRIGGDSSIYPNNHTQPKLTARIKQ